MEYREQDGGRTTHPRRRWNGFSMIWPDPYYENLRSLSRFSFYFSLSFLPFALMVGTRLSASFFQRGFGFCIDLYSDPWVRSRGCI